MTRTLLMHSKERYESVDILASGSHPCIRYHGSPKAQEAESKRRRNTQGQVDCIVVPFNLQSSHPEVLSPHADAVFSVIIGSIFSPIGDEDSSRPSMILRRVACPPFPVKSRTIPLKVLAMLCRPSHSGNKPTQRALQKSHRMPTETQPVKNYDENQHEANANSVSV